MIWGRLGDEELMGQRGMLGSFCQPGTTSHLGQGTSVEELPPLVLSLGISMGYFLES